MKQEDITKPVWLGQCKSICMYAVYALMLSTAWALMLA